MPASRFELPQNKAVGFCPMGAGCPVMVFSAEKHRAVGADNESGSCRGGV